MANVTEPVILDSTGQQMKNAILKVAEAVSGKRVGPVYGFHVDGSISDPASMITYLEDAVGMVPAKMNYTTGKFDYGSWKDSFFMPRPCMLGYDGKVKYYLNPNDYSKKEDGTASDIANTAFAGNAMMEWPQIWIKIVPDQDTKSGTVYISSYKVDENFHAWSNYNSKNELVDHFYTPIYNGSVIDGKLRSVSGRTYDQLCQSNNATTEMNYAKANNPVAADVMWTTEVYADVLTINMLLLLIGKNTNTQATFGNGRYNQASAASSMLGTGTMNDKGLFYGSNGATEGVKVFGMENYWGNQWRRYAGHICANGVEKVKMTYGIADGSSVVGYNTDGSGYLPTGVTGHTGSSGGYVNQMFFSALGITPAAVSGSASTYWCDGTWFNDGATTYAFRGGLCDNDLKVGAFYFVLSGDSGSASWNIGASVSCKPLA